MKDFAPIKLIGSFQLGLPSEAKPILPMDFQFNLGSTVRPEDHFGQVERRTRALMGCADDYRHAFLSDQLNVGTKSTQLGLSGIHDVGISGSSTRRRSRKDRVMIDLNKQTLFDLRHYPNVPLRDSNFLSLSDGQKIDHLQNLIKVMIDLKNGPLRTYSILMYEMIDQDLPFLEAYRLLTQICAYLDLYFVEAGEKANFDDDLVAIYQWTQHRVAVLRQTLSDYVLGLKFRSEEPIVIVNDMFEIEDKWTLPKLKDDVAAFLEGASQTNQFVFDENIDVDQAVLMLQRHHILRRVMFGKYANEGLRYQGHQVCTEVK